MSVLWKGHGFEPGSAVLRRLTSTSWCLRPVGESAFLHTGILGIKCPWGVSFLPRQVHTAPVFPPHRHLTGLLRDLANKKGSKALAEVTAIKRSAGVACLSGMPAKSLCLK